MSSVRLSVTLVDQDHIGWKSWKLIARTTRTTRTIFRLPPIISGTGKAANFQFCTHILSIDRNKSPLQILGKVAVC